jgi:hypothetical protein
MDLGDTVEVKYEDFSYGKGIIVGTGKEGERVVYLSHLNIFMSDISTTRYYHFYDKQYFTTKIVLFEKVKLATFNL